MKNNLLILTIIATLAPSANLLFAMGNPQSAAAQAAATQSQSLEVTKAAKDQADAKKKEVDKELTIQKVVQAIQAKDLSGVQKYIDEGGDVDDEDNCGSPLLSRCVDKDNIEAARLLLAKDANVNTKEGDPLRTAIYRRNQAMVNFFLDHGADIEMRYSGETPLMYALKWVCNSYEERSEYEKIAELLMRRGADVNTKQFGDWNSEPALLRMISMNRRGGGVDLDFGINRCLGTIKTLLRWGADFTSDKVRRQLDFYLRERAARVKDKSSSEQEAIKELKIYMKELPLNKAAIAECLHWLGINQDINETELEGIITAFIEEPVYFAKQRREIYKAIRDREYWRIAFSIDDAPFLLKERDATGHTLLLSAVYQGDHEAMDAFCKAGADIDVQTHDGQTAYMIADRQLKAAEDEATGERYKAVKNTLNHHRAKREEVKLAKLKADEERAKKEDADALIEFDRLKRAITDGDANALSDCDKSMLDKNGPALLLHAAKLGRTAIVEKLLEQKVPVDKRDEEYHTALMVAVINCNVETVAVLLKHMAPEHIKMTLHGKTAYELAQEAAAKPGYEQRLEKYKQIMAMLDSYNNAAAVSKK